MGSVVVEIRDADEVLSASTFLHAHLDPRLGVDGWSRALTTSFTASPPHHGLLAREGQEVLAVLLTFFSERSIAGRAERFCNLGAWCARPDRRFEGLRLLRTALRIPDHHFTDLSPSGTVVPLNERLGFRHLDTTSSLLPCLPLPVRGTVLTDPDEIASSLSSADLRVHADHRQAAAAHQVLLRDDDGECLVVYRLERRKGVRALASVLHVTGQEDFQRRAPLLTNHLLRRHGTLALILEHRVTGTRRGALPFRRARPRMYRSSSLGPGDVDLLRSELCAVPW